jgi:DNA ligase (NAD+)
MDIDGLGEAVALQLLEQQLIFTPVDLYKLAFEDISKLPRMGKKSAENLLKAIENSKQRDLSRLIFALGIRNVGLKAAQLLADRFGTIDKIMEASGEELSAIDGIGEVIAYNIVDFFSHEHNRLRINGLKELGVNTARIKEPKKNGVLSGKTFVLTGSLPSMTRSEAAQLIKNAGGKVGENVSKNTSYIIAGENPGSKLAKGIDYKITVLDEQMFLNLLDMI